MKKITRTGEGKQVKYFEFCSVFFTNSIFTTKTLDMTNLKFGTLTIAVLFAFLFSFTNTASANSFLPAFQNENSVDDDALKIKIKIIIIIKKKKKGLIGEITKMSSIDGDKKLGRNEFFATISGEKDNFLLEVAGLKEKLNYLKIGDGFTATDDLARIMDKNFLKLGDIKLKPSGDSLGSFEIQD